MLHGGVITRVLHSCVTNRCLHYLHNMCNVEVGVIAKHGKNSIPQNLIVRLSAMYPDKPVQIPASLQNVPGITASNVHTKTPIGSPCKAPKQNGACLDCRECWTDSVISYELH